MRKKAKPPGKTARTVKTEEVREILKEEAQIASGAPALSAEEQAAFQVRKWRIIHKFIHANPFHVSDTLPRSEQWRRVLRHLKQSVDEAELTDWLIIQVDVAANIESGIRDLRPRRSEPCFELVLEYVANRKRKALAILKWARGKGEPV
jgi:hypothetical protein